MNIEQMTISDFLDVMKANEGVYEEYDALPDIQKRLLANLNICTGVAESYRDAQGRLLGVGGIRYCGIGEGWMAVLPEIRTPILLRKVMLRFQQIADEKNLWRLFATSKISENFLQHLQFHKDESVYIWTRPYE